MFYICAVQYGNHTRYQILQMRTRIFNLNFNGHMWLLATMLGIIPAAVVSIQAWLATRKWLGITGITPQLGYRKNRDHSKHTSVNSDIHQ